MQQEFNSIGKCVYCNETIEKGKINTHLKKHLKEAQKENSNGNSFLIQVFGYPNYKNSPYFLYILADGEAKIKDVDQFLRDIWLDCCGHMSEFHFKGGGKLSKSKMLNEVLEKNDVVEYEYDFGSTTYLQMKVIEEFSVKSPKKIYLLTRNEPLEIYCHLCNQNPATQICTIHQWEEEPHMFCEECAPKHAEVCSDFEDYATMPIVNSPRMGECGYVGGLIDTERDGVFVLKK